MRLLLAFPLMLIPLVVYGFVATGTGVAAFDQTWLSLSMISGAQVVLSVGDAVLGLGIAMLFLEVVKATRIGFAPIADHVLSVLTVIVFVVLFIVWQPAGTGLFALLSLIALVDVLAGLWISLNVARRDVAIAPGGTF
ncbi:MAG: hypothetical protein KI785_11565 [Devosiaceae bacterium]|nr:hypothetical protein [Devosiaceae bacterium MH13]